MDEIQLLWAYYEDQRDNALKFDQQRTSVTGFSFLSAGALFAILANKGFGEYSAIVSIFLILLGIFGILATRELHERAEFNFSRARVALSKIEQKIGKSIFEEVKEEAKIEHQGTYRMAMRIRLHFLWMIPNIFITILGLASLLKSI
ncbi:hypothetical protein [Candidatus Thiosymbion oneisti]|uniref:hypothetical protein n=1 Tax=Candidatus Thiosymbion oneisti TaxID=589554 RepID=UPI00105EF119|nr:hypothetical protein [Candidatus Thiosymbion oneisti]